MMFRLQILMTSNIKYSITLWEFMEHEKKHIKQNVNPENNASKQQLDIQRRLFIKYFS